MGVSRQPHPAVQAARAEDAQPGPYLDLALASLARYGPLADDLRATTGLDVELQTADIKQVDITLSLGSSAETVTVTAEGVDVPSISLPPVSGAQVKRLGESQGLSWVNGRVTRT